MGREGRVEMRGSFERRDSILNTARDPNDPAWDEVNKNGRAQRNI